MKKNLNNLVIGVLMVSLMVSLVVIRNKSNESDYYHKLHNRQTWMLEMLDDDTNKQLAEKIEERMDEDTDDVLSEKYEYMNYEHNKF